MSIPDAEPENAYGPQDQHRLRLVSCEACEQKDRAMQAMGVDIENLEADVKAKNRIIGKLKAELQAERRESPFHADAQVIFEYWRDKCRPGARSFGDDRLKAVLGRLNEKVRVPGEKRKQPAYSPRYICEAIFGASLDPPVDKHGVPWNDLELICRDSSHLERYHAIYEQWRAQTDAAQ